MTSPLSGPQIPLAVGELVYVALDHAVKFGNMDAKLRASMQKVLHRYNRDRTMALSQRGIPVQAVAVMTETASQKFVKWMAEQDGKVVENDADFDSWAKELEDGE